MDKIKGASTDALKSFKAFALNPVGEVANVYDSLGDTRALGVGITFGVVAALCFIFGGLTMIDMRMTDIFSLIRHDFGMFIKLLFCSCVPFVAVTVACFGSRNVFKGSGGIGADTFVAGCALLPFAFIALLSSILGMGNFEVIAALGVFAICFVILILFFGFLRIGRLSERTCTLLVPATLLLAAWITKIIFTAMMKPSMGPAPGWGTPPPGFN